MFHIQFNFIINYGCCKIFWAFTRWISLSTLFFRFKLVLPGPWVRASRMQPTLAIWSGMSIFLQKFSRQMFEKATPFLKETIFSHLLNGLAFWNASHDLFKLTTGVLWAGSNSSATSSSPRTSRSWPPSASPSPTSLSKGSTFL